MDGLATNQIAKSVDVFYPLIAAVNELIDLSGDPASFKKALADKLTSKEFIQDLAIKLLNGIHAADALGRSYVVRKEKFYSDQSKTISAKFRVGKYTVRANGIKWIVADDKPGVQISFNLTPEQALQYFRYKAFWISGIENQRFIDAVKLELERVLSEGKTYDQFAEAFKKFFVEYGVTPENAIRVDTIFRTNLFASYTAGQVKQVDEVKDKFPVWRYIAVRDNRTRPSHLALNGHLFRRGPYPPISFNCRCVPQFIHSLQLRQLGDVQIYNTIYELIDLSEVVDFLDTDTFDQWVGENPVSAGIRNVLEAGSK